MHFKLTIIPLERYCFKMETKGISTFRKMRETCPDFEDQEAALDLELKHSSERAISYANKDKFYSCCVICKKSKDFGQ